MKIQQIRNATLKIEYGGCTILVDPWLQDRGTGFSAKTVDPKMDGVRCPLIDLPYSPSEILRNVDYCLVTHIHPDHFTADYLPKEIKILVQNEEDRNTVLSMGFTEVIAIEKEFPLKNSATVIKVPAIHGDNKIVSEMMGSVSGYILRGKDKTLYIAGDTVYCDSVAKNIKNYRP